MTNKFDGIRKTNFQMYQQSGAMRSHHHQPSDIQAFRKAHCIPDEVHVLLRQRVVGIVSMYADTRNPLLPNIHQPMGVDRLWRLCYLLANEKNPESSFRSSGTYIDAVRAMGEFPEEYTHPLAFYGISKLMNEAQERDLWYAGIKEKMDRNPELGYLALTRSPRSTAVVNSDSFFYYMHGTMVGLLMQRGVKEEEIFGEVVKHNKALRLIAMGMSWGRCNAYLQITQAEMIKLGLALLDGNYGGFDTIDFTVKEITTDLQLQGDVGLPVLRDAGPGNDGLVEYKGETITKGEAYDRMVKEIKAVLEDTHVEFIHPDSPVESKYSALKNLSSTLGQSEVDVMMTLNTLLHEKNSELCSVEIIKGRTGGVIPGGLSKSDWGGFLAARLIAAGHPVTIPSDDMECSSLDRKDLIVLGGIPQMGKSAVKSLLEEGYRTIASLDSIEACGYNKGNTFIPKSNSVEVVGGKNRSWPKAKARKGSK